MPDRILYAVERFTGRRTKFLTLHDDGSLTAEGRELAEAIPRFQNRGWSNELIFEYWKRKYYTYEYYIEGSPDGQ